MANREDPLTGFHFAVDVQGVIKGFFTECSGLGSEHEVIEHILEEKELLTPSQNQRFYEIIVEQFSGGGLGVHDVKSK